VITPGGSIRELVKSATKLGYDAFPFKTRDSCGGDAGPSDFSQASDTMLPQICRKALPLACELP
jgi:hypothetical protein